MILQISSAAAVLGAVYGAYKYFKTKYAVVVTGVATVETKAEDVVKEVTADVKEAVTEVQKVV